LKRWANWKAASDVFDAMHKENRSSTTKPAVPGMAANKGADRKKLEEAYDSFAVQTKTQRAIQMTKLYGITGTPSVVVDAIPDFTGMTLSATNQSITPASTAVLTS